MAAWEVAVAGGLHAGDAVLLEPGGTVTVGRGAGCDLRLTDPEVSRRHLVVRGGDVAELEDLDSRNGVVFNGYRIRSAEITAATMFQAGETVLAVRPPTPADALVRKDD